jgi:hypothetical protein
MDSIPAQHGPNSTISISRVSLAKPMDLITNSILPKAAPWMGIPRLHSSTIAVKRAFVNPHQPAGGFHRKLQFIHQFH